MEQHHFKLVFLFGVFLCLLSWPSCIDAHTGNCTAEHTKMHLETCATEHLKTLDVTVFFDRDARDENIITDPLKFVTNRELCNNSKEAADYMECSIGVFEKCATNTSREDIHTSPAKAKKAVEKFCEGLDMILKKVEFDDFEQCLKKDEQNVFSCAESYVIKDEDGAVKDVCNEHKIYTTCMAEMDECGGEEGKKLALFSTWAEHMTPQKCTDPAGAGCSVGATLWLLLITALLCMVEGAHW